MEERSEDTVRLEELISWAKDISRHGYSDIDEIKSFIEEIARLR